MLFLPLSFFALGGYILIESNPEGPEFEGLTASLVKDREMIQCSLLPKWRQRGTQFRVAIEMIMMAKMARPS